MFKANDNYLKLPGDYLFSTVDTVFPIKRHINIRILEYID